ncbi:MAG TPA: hypothetical protein EYO75_03590 [Sulfurimonas sp.]|nr:hypothetical protein [Sulfurimonas sp.]HIM74780.1 hypothetical protein [Campylobacterales bacterium]
MAKRITCKCCGTVRVINKTSGFTGVDLWKGRKKKNNEVTPDKWRARATDNSGVTHHLGYHKTDLEASKVYDEYIINNKIVNRPLNHPKEAHYGK